MEMVDGMSAGEAVFVLVKEVFKKVKCVLWSDSQSAISILNHRRRQLEDETFEDEILLRQTGGDERRLARAQSRRSDDSGHRNEGAAGI